MRRIFMPATALFAAFCLGSGAAIAADSNPGTSLDFLVKIVDYDALDIVTHGPSPYLTAASKAFVDVLQPYYLAAGDSARAGILERLRFSCAENNIDPAAKGGTLRFPLQLVPGSNGVAVWHRYACTFSIDYRNALGLQVRYTSPLYALNQLDLRYGAVDVEPGVAFQNYNLGTARAPAYPWLGRYLQPLNLLLRDRDDTQPARLIGGVNGGHDYRVNAWNPNGHNDNICPPRYSQAGDRFHFYNHPLPAECPLGADGLPSCASGGKLPFDDDMGDTLVYLAAAQRAKSWRKTPFQSYNCGGEDEKVNRGAMIFYADAVATKLTAPSAGDVAALADGARQPLSALGTGPLLIDGGRFTYDQPWSEQGVPLNNYEVGGVTGVGYEPHPDGSLTLHIVAADGSDDEAGLHNWLLGLYLLSPYAQSEGAIALGHGGDTGFWINPQTPAVQAVLKNPKDANYAYFKYLFVDNGNPGIASNCSGFGNASIGCGARPVHNGLFVYSK
jgi:hypothetical protein